MVGKAKGRKVKKLRRNFVVIKHLTVGNYTEEVKKKKKKAVILFGGLPAAVLLSLCVLLNDFLDSFIES